MCKKQKRESFERMTLGVIRRRPTLPGRFQPSTISVLRLNFCVRDGNRWIPQAIVTGNMGLSRWDALASPSLAFWLRYALSRGARFASLRICSFDPLDPRFPFLAPSKPHRFAFASLRLTKALFRYSLRHSSLLQIIFPGLRFRYQGFASLSRFLSLIPIP